MATATAIRSRVKDAEPYKGDDWAQYLARTMAAPLFLMGIMAVLAALGLGIAGGVNVSDFFAGVSHPADYFGRSQVLGQLTGAVGFLGMGLVLGGIVFYLVNVVRTLRDAGRDVQSSLGADALKLRKPWTGHLTPHVMIMGIAAEITAFVVGVLAAVRVGELPAGVVAHPASATTAQIAHLGFANAASAWLPGLRFAGLAILLSSVVLVLLTIQKTLRFQAQRITEIADESRAGGVPPVLDDVSGVPLASTTSKARPAAAAS